MGSVPHDPVDTAEPDGAPQLTPAHRSGLEAFFTQYQAPESMSETGAAVVTVCTKDTACGAVAVHVPTSTLVAAVAVRVAGRQQRAQVGNRRRRIWS